MVVMVSDDVSDDGNLGQDESLSAEPLVEKSQDVADNGEAHKRQADLVQQVSEKEARKLRARHTREQSIWFGLGMFGTIGWSVAVPTLLGVLLGLWLDATWPGSISWTITLLFAGLALGCLNAWYWVTREREMIERARTDLNTANTDLNHDGGSNAG